MAERDGTPRGDLDWVKNLPAHLRDRPVDERRKVPVPYMNTMGDGTVNFTGIDFTKVVECAENELCGICSKPLDYWIAFIGGPVSASTRVYSDPPFHKDCARAAMEYCPHIRVKNHRRTPDEKQPEDSFASPLAVVEKPAQWIITYTRGYKVIPHGPGLLFLAHTIHHRDVFEYDEDGNLQEITNG